MEFWTKAFLLLLICSSIVYVEGQECMEAERGVDYSNNASVFLLTYEIINTQNGSQA